MLKFWDTNKVGEIPDAMSKQLTARYSLSEKNIMQFRYVSRSGKFVGQKTTYIRIFAPALLKDGVKLIRRYDDLATQMGAILFEGRLDGGRIVDIFDRRSIA